jgi:hypothetical protein
MSYKYEHAWLADLSMDTRKKEQKNAELDLTFTQGSVYSLLNPADLLGV